MGLISGMHCTLLWCVAESKSELSKKYHALHQDSHKKFKISEVLGIPIKYLKLAQTLADWRGISARLRARAPSASGPSWRLRGNSPT